MTVNHGEATMTREEYIDRYKKRIAARSDWTYEQAQHCVDAVSFEELSEYYEDDPQGAADEEMSNWETL